MHFSFFSIKTEENRFIDIEVLIRIDYAFQKVLSNIVILNSDVFLELVHLNNEKEIIEEEKRVV